MKVICINNIEIIKQDNPYIKSREYHWKVLNVGHKYTVKGIHGRSNDKYTFFIEELYQFIPAELFISIEEWREQQINKICN